MATNVTIDQSFVGREAGGIFTKAFQEMDAIKLFEVVNYSGGVAYLRKTLLNGQFVNYACGFQPSGEIDITDKEVIVAKQKMDIELCKETFRNTWTGHQMGLSAWNKDIPADEKEAILLEVKRKIADYFNTKLFGDLLAEADNDADVIKVAGVVIDETNVEAELMKVIKATPKAVIKQKGFAIIVSGDVKRAYDVAVQNANYGRDMNYFAGVKLEVAESLEENTMLAFSKGNLKLVAGLASDFNRIDVKDMDDLSDQIRIKVVLAMKSTYVDGSELVVYSA